MQSCNLIRLRRLGEQRHLHKVHIFAPRTWSEPLRCTTAIRSLKIQLICSSLKRISARQVSPAWAAFGLMRMNLACTMTYRRPGPKSASLRAANVTFNHNFQRCLALQKVWTAWRLGIKKNKKPVKMIILLVRSASRSTKSSPLTSILFPVLIRPAKVRHKMKYRPKSKKNWTARLMTKHSSFAMKFSMAATWWTKTRAASMTYLASSWATVRTSMRINGIAHLPTFPQRLETASFISQISNLSDVYSY